LFADGSYPFSGTLFIQREIKKEVLKMLKSFAFFLISGILGIAKEALLRSRRLRIMRKRNLNIAIQAKKQKNEGILIIANHPSLLETIIIPLLFWPQSVFNSSLMPISTPDEKNFHRGELFGKYLKPFVKFFMSLVPSIFISRGNARKSVEALETIREKLEKGMLVLIFPEGKRTGKEYDETKLRILNNKRIRKFQNGISSLLRNARKPFVILPVWVEGGEEALPINSKIPKIWKRLQFHFGRPWRVKKSYKNFSREEILDLLERRVLEAKK
jgi:1-acyl-sn-glycerol-3-phosphate acyltransferase